MPPSTIASALRLQEKLQVRARLVFDTAWRIGSGREGQTSDLGVLLDAAGRCCPALPSKASSAVLARPWPRHLGSGRAC